jgi:hypothetical protein
MTDMKTCKLGHRHNDNICKVCERERQRRYYAKNRVMIIERNANYAAEKFGWTRKQKNVDENR